VVKGDLGVALLHEIKQIRELKIWCINQIISKHWRDLMITRLEERPVSHIWRVKLFHLGTFSLKH